ncbi:MAG: hypothetical protein JW767_07325 [Thermoleophilia bacterium]|nr:hypothetical protein [Thermoleophilia bacterium]
MTDTPDKNWDANAPDEGATTNVPDDDPRTHVPEDSLRTNVPDERAPYDDDRLLAFALRLEEDAELEAALDDDEELRRRLEALQAGLDDVGSGLERLVPAPDETYADPAAARWDGLRPFFAPPPARRPARGRWRVLVPALGAILAVAVVGAFALRDGPIGGQRATDEAGTAAESADAPAVGADASKSSYGAGDLAADIELFETAFVARAGEVTDGRQRFTVVRQVKGTVTGDVYLDVVDQPIPVETLTLVMFGAPALGADGDAPVPAPTAPEDEALQRLRATAFLTLDAQGVSAVAIPLPPDVDLDQLLP